jgi:hypothetical protein
LLRILKITESTSRFYRGGPWCRCWRELHLVDQVLAADVLLRELLDRLSNGDHLLACFRFELVDLPTKAGKLRRQNSLLLEFLWKN